MNIETGEIISPEMYKELFESGSDKVKKYIPVNIDLTPKQLKRNKIGRNDPCACGSGIKFKKCCLNKSE